MTTSTFEVRSTGLHDLIPSDAVVERVAGGFTFTEGPIWFGDSLLFSDIPNHRIVRWRQLPEGPEVTTFALGPCNGLALDRHGRVLICGQSGRDISRIGEDGRRAILATKYQGKALNSPNDIVVKSGGSVYFTDPPYGLAVAGNRVVDWYAQSMPGKELPFSGVYLMTADGVLTLVADDFALPNGLAFSPDEATLYINDSARRHIRAFDVRADGTLGDGRVLLELNGPEPGVPDGMKVDKSGNIFCTGPGGVWVCRPDGEVLGRILLPELPANLAWGGSDWSTLFVTARTSVYCIQTSTQGIPVMR